MNGSEPADGTRLFQRLRNVRDLAASGALARDEAYTGGRVAYEGALARLRDVMRRDLGVDRAVAL
ncbi:hypothetical protein [Streptomyces sp. LaPpAH-108]|uniref:hypothetical protein n=1 Tax=Streptomyces sp. LaPpAH-108 TaxID=1155714 RepID=UPI00037CE2E2|nr:hypothetical protein [Streptomyces sp. LaPpAH-108]